VAACAARPSSGSRLRPHRSGTIPRRRTRAGSPKTSPCGARGWGPPPTSSFLHDVPYRCRSRSGCLPAMVVAGGVLISARAQCQWPVRFDARCREPTMTLSRPARRERSPRCADPWLTRRPRLGECIAVCSAPALRRPPLAPPASQQPGRPQGRDWPLALSTGGYERVARSMTIAGMQPPTGKPCTIAWGWPATPSQKEEAAGTMVPTKHRIAPRAADGQALGEPLRLNRFPRRRVLLSRRSQGRRRER
jgi:hypothetical protein